MRLFDTHCHFETQDRDEIAAILSRARAAGVEKLVAVGGSDALNAAAEVAARVSAQRTVNSEQRTENSEQRTENSEQRTDAEGSLPSVLTAIGYDREQVEKFHNCSLFTVHCSLFTVHCSLRRSPSAVGEIGLDYHYSPETRKAQLALFAAQLEEARKRDLPVVVHTREAADDTIGLLKEIPSRGVIHCFTGDPREARAYLDLGFFVSISGIVTFKAAENVRTTAKYVPDDRILIETDAPFLAPVPMRGQPNEPAFIRHTCEFLATLRGLSPEAFADLTFANGERAFASPASA